MGSTCGPPAWYSVFEVWTFGVKSPNDFRVQHCCCPPLPWGLMGRMPISILVMWQFVGIKPNITHWNFTTWVPFKINVQLLDRSSELVVCRFLFPTKMHTHHPVKKLWCFILFLFLFSMTQSWPERGRFLLTATLGRQNKRTVSVVLSCTDKWAPKWCGAAKLLLPQAKGGLGFPTTLVWPHPSESFQPHKHELIFKKRKKKEKREKASLMSFKVKLWSHATTYQSAWREVIVYAATRLSCGQNLFFFPTRNSALLLFHPLQQERHVCSANTQPWIHLRAFQTLIAQNPLAPFTAGALRGTARPAVSCRHVRRIKFRCKK